MNSHFALTGPDLFYQALTWAPYWVVCIGGIVTCGILWNTCPRAAALALLGLVLTLLAAVAQPIAFSVLISAQASGRMEASQFRFVLGLVGFAFSAVRAVGYAILVAAVFIGRRPLTLDPAPPIQPTIVR